MKPMPTARYRSGTRYPLVHVASWSYTLPVSLFLDSRTMYWLGSKPSSNLVRPCEDPGWNSSPWISWQNFALGLSWASQQAQTDQLRLTKYSEKRQNGHIGWIQTAMLLPSPAGRIAPWPSMICSKDLSLLLWLAYLLLHSARQRRDTDSIPLLLYPKLQLSSDVTYQHTLSP